MEKTSVLTPVMGYNTFHDIGTNSDPRSATSVSEVYLKQVVDQLVSSGMREAGYLYVNIDDAWMANERDKDGKLIADPERFPGGMKALTDYIHSRGLKAGIYLTCGKLTYAGLPGSLGYEQKDADQIAEWGFDFLKYDYRNDEAGGNIGRDSRKENETMRDALKNNKSGRIILFSLCQHGKQAVWEWGASVGSMWRISTDVKDIWEGELDEGWSFNKIIDDVMVNISEYSGRGGYNDPDLLLAGHNQSWLGKDRKLQPFEQRTQFSLWCLLAAPLIHGYNPARNDAYAYETLMNRELIAVDQDPLGRQGIRVRHDTENKIDCFVKPLHDGSLAVGLYNRSESNKEITIAWEELGMAPDSPAEVRDLWSHSEQGIYTAGYTRSVNSHECAVLKLTFGKE